ncbi:MAG: aminodeoxychorismate/anthranilate synthase component II [Ferruginibacter sp.]|nr:aminodeoxychorismate/anthranilate synthase component II [Cytophagales bacterium]
MKTLVLDNYDSFTYNLVYLLKELGAAVEVHRNDKIALEEVERFDKILLSPGPGIPSEAGIMQALIREYAPVKSILGVCLGHQGIAEVFGATLENMGEVRHGVATKAIIEPGGERLFRGVPPVVQVGRYHSWTVVPHSVPDTVSITAVDENGQVMALSHKTYDVKGVQFHPESILTEHGKRILENWLSQ